MEERVRAPWWLWANLLSLDAPLVAVVWQHFLAHCFAPILYNPARWVLGLTVWAIYLADRLLDVRHPPVAYESRRHRFYRRNRATAGVTLGIVVTADLFIALIWLKADVFSSGLLTALAVLIYLAIFAAWRLGRRQWKQPSAAILFTTGIFLVAWTRSAHPWQTLGWPAAAFCAVCLGNITLVETWERGVANQRIWLWLLLIAAACAAFGDSRWYASVALSGVALALLDLRSQAISQDARRVLADAVLLTPLLFRWI